MPAAFTAPPTPDSEPSLVTVITPSLNQGEFIEDCLTSVQNQTHSRIEHLVIDGGSTDRTLEVLRSASTRDNLRWVSEPDRGQAHAINKGLDLARGAIVCWLNTDDRFFDARVLEKVVAAFTDHPEIDLVVGDGYSSDRDGRLRGPLVLRPEYLNLQKMRHADFVLQPSAFWRRNELRLDETYHYAFDWRFFLEMFERRSNVYYLREYLSVYRSYGGNKTALDNAARKAEVFRIVRHRLGPLNLCAVWCAIVFVLYRVAELARLPLLKTATRQANVLLAKVTGYRLVSC
jgi:glycosyltransferase involved in cell wall biosynthesis